MKKYILLLAVSIPMITTSSAVVVLTENFDTPGAATTGGNQIIPGTSLAIRNGNVAQSVGGELVITTTGMAAQAISTGPNGSAALLSVSGGVDVGDTIIVSYDLVSFEATTPGGSVTLGNGQFQIRGLGGNLNPSSSTLLPGTLTDGDSGSVVAEFTVATAGTSLEFFQVFSGDPGTYTIDNFQIEVIPEPSSTLLLGLGGLALLRRRR